MSPIREALRKPYLYAGIAVVLVALLAFVTAGGAIASGHPSYAIAYGTGLVVGLAAIAASLAWRERRTRWVRASATTIGLALCSVALWWLTPFEAKDPALRAMASDGVVSVESSSTVITLTPVGATADVGVIFQPGARVDARAYANILRPIAEAGHQVVIVKPPLGIAFLSAGTPAAWASDHPETATWFVAGHSLGGVVAAQNAADSDALGGLILWASYPVSDLSLEPCAVTSVFGTRDGLTTLDDVEASRADLPPDTTFVPVVGANHSQFGDYGPQAGDGEAAIARDDAQRQIVAATLRSLSQG